jgi:hypothetical protein
MNNAVFWDVGLHRSCVNRRFGGTSVNTISTKRHITEDGIINIISCENLKSYIRNLVSHDVSCLSSEKLICFTLILYKKQFKG